jgi:hypothetical protein
MGAHPCHRQPFIGFTTPAAHPAKLLTLEKFTAKKREICAKQMGSSCETVRNTNAHNQLIFNNITYQTSRKKKWEAMVALRLPFLLFTALAGTGKLSTSVRIL